MEKWLISIKGIKGDVYEAVRALRAIASALAKEMGVTILKATTMGTVGMYYLEVESSREKAEEFAKELLSRAEELQLTRILTERTYVIYPIS